MNRRLHLCRAEGLIGREIRQCRAFASRDGYCWAHHLYVHGAELWGDHWERGPGFEAPPTCAPVPMGTFGDNSSLCADAVPGGIGQK